MLYTYIYIKYIAFVVIVHEICSFYLISAPSQIVIQIFLQTNRKFHQFAFLSCSPGIVFQSSVNRAIYDWNNYLYFFFFFFCGCLDMVFFVLWFYLHCPALTFTFLSFAQPLISVFVFVFCTERTRISYSFFRFSKLSVFCRLAYFANPFAFFCFG